MKTADVIIVGAGPAGSVCARKLSEGGADVLLLDKSQFPRSKPCAGWVTPGVFEMLGPLFPAYPHDCTEYRRFSIAVKRLKLILPVRQYAVRRVEFDHWLVKHCHVPVVRHEVRHIEKRGDAYVIDQEFSAKSIVGAGGTRCPVYRTFFRDAANRAPEDFITALEEEFHYPGADPRCRLWFLQEGLPGYAWYVPKGNDIVNVGIGGKAEGLRSQGVSLKQHWDRFIRKLEQHHLITGHSFKPSGWNYYLRRSPEVLQRDAVLLAGDAAGLSTRDMGEGIAAAVYSGIKAAEALLEGKEYRLDDLRRYSLFSILFGR